MNEKLLQFIWQHQYYNKAALCTTDGEPLEIIKPGMLNTNQGPDFLMARIRAGETAWAGNIELHVLASDWQQHGHTEDEHYRNVILHVVWKDDTPKQDNLGFPVLELQSRVPKLLLSRYKKLMESPSFIPCGTALSAVPELVITAWKEKLQVERLEEKVRSIFAALLETGDHWEEVFWRYLCRNFGTKVNSGAFEAMARTLPFQVMSRNRQSLVKLEALLMGQSGLLSDSYTDDYPLELKREYLLTKRKYHLARPVETVLFLRMRPLAFPTIRLSQLAHFIHQFDKPFARIINTNDIEDIRRMFRLPVSEYWNNHYRFDHVSGRKNKTMGEEMTGNIIINTISPFVFAWGIYQSDENMKQKALNWLMQVKPEENVITKGFRKLGIGIASAHDSQALTQLKNAYCREKRCLQCAAGSSIMRKE